MKKIRFIPYGYTVRNGCTVINREEATVIRYIFEEYIKGASLKELAEELTQRKVPYTEKTDVWDKARIARIIENARYIGDDEYDPIIDEKTYEGAVSAKTARQRNAMARECESITLLRNRIKCAKCGSPMVRRVNSRRLVKESWACSNPECGCRCRISDGDLLAKINLLINRIIENTELMLPKPKVKTADSVEVMRMQQAIDAELEREHPSEAYIMDKISDIAEQLYRESKANDMIVAQVARKRASLMRPQESFNDDYFTDLADYITMSDKGTITLHTKVNTEITEDEGEKDDGCYENT